MSTASFRGRVPLASIDHIVSLHLGIARNVKSQRPDLVFARHVGMYLAHVEYRWSFTAIGTFYKLHHTTAVHGVEKIADHLKTDNELPLLLDQLKSEIVEYHDKSEPIRRINTTAAHDLIPRRKLIDVQMQKLAALVAERLPMERLADMIAERLYQRRDRTTAA